MKRIFSKFLVVFAMVAGCFNFFVHNSKLPLVYVERDCDIQQTYRSVRNALGECQSGNEIVHDTVYVNKEVLSEKAINLGKQHPIR